MGQNTKLKIRLKEVKWQCGNKAGSIQKLRPHWGRRLRLPSQFRKDTIRSRNTDTALFSGTACEVVINWSQVKILYTIYWTWELDLPMQKGACLKPLGIHCGHATRSLLCLGARETYHCLKFPSLFKLLGITEFCCCCCCFSWRAFVFLIFTV